MNHLLIIDLFINDACSHFWVKLENVHLLYPIPSQMSMVNYIYIYRLYDEWSNI